VNYKEYFLNKKVVVIGLGPHGEMIPDIKFLLKNRVDVALYDMRNERRLKSFISELSNIGLEKSIFGRVDGDNLLNFDLIILSPEISKKSIFLKKAIQAEIQIEYPDTLFFKLSPPITLIGVFGLYGKSSVTNMIYHILKKSFSDYKDQGLFLIDQDSTHGVLTHLKKIKKDDVVLARIPEQLLKHYYDIHISPHVAVVTSKIDFDILNFQTYNNFIVAPDDVVDAIKKEKDLNSKAKILRTRPNMVPVDWKINSKIVYHKDNIALTIQTCELFKVPVDIMKDIIEGTQHQRGCIEFIKKVDGIEFFNDASSITPDSTLAALKSVSLNKNTVLILGGAYTGYDYLEMIKEISNYAHTVILLPGSGSLGIRPHLEELENVNFIQASTLEDSIEKAKSNARKGEIVLFSPGFEAVGIDISRKERGEKFVKLIRGL